MLDKFLVCEDGKPACRWYGKMVCQHLGEDHKRTERYCNHPKVRMNNTSARLQDMNIIECTMFEPDTLDAESDRRTRELERESAAWKQTAKSSSEAGITINQLLREKIGDCKALQDQVDGLTALCKKHGIDLP